MADRPIIPADDDVRHDDLEFNPALEPGSAKAWLNLLEEAEDAFEDWNDHCDLIDRKFANLERLGMMNRDREFQMFWANVEVLKPSIYAKPPIPVVVPKFKDRRPVYQAASEVMERCCVVAFDLAHINELMLLVRDDVVMHGRGVPWVRYEDKGSEDYDYEKVCIDHKHRRDFLHSISRSWREVEWVAGASYLTRAQARDRFKKHSGDAYQEAEYKVDKDAKEIGGGDNRERAKFWEIWHKSERRVVWVAKGCDEILDEGEPHLKLQDYFPCPKPAYGTVQPGSLIPVPDVLQYHDQLDEVNSLTGRIHALSEALSVKGFYPAGAGEVGDAIQTAIRLKTSGVTMVPISNWAAFGGSKDVIIWLPIDQIATVVQTLIMNRKEMINDIYEITGLSDIMRGATDARETLGAQQLKTQFGSSRVRDKQLELVRIARDLVGITSEIITEVFDPVTIIEMSQTQLPTQQMQQQQIMQLTQNMQVQQQQIDQAQQDPRFSQAQQADPQKVQMLMEEARKAMEAGQNAIKQMQDKATIEQVLYFLKNNKSKAFTLDIETDSTVMIDENGEKERRGEFVQVLTPMLQQIGAMVTATPQSAEFCGELLKWTMAPFRVGRTMDGAIDNLIELMKTEADKVKGDDQVTAQNKTALQIEQMKTDAVKAKDQADVQLKQQELMMRDSHEKMKVASNEKIKLLEIESRQGDGAMKAQQVQQKARADAETHQAKMIELAAKRQADAEKASLAQAAQQAKMRDAQTMSQEKRAQMQLKSTQGGGWPP